MDLFTKYNGEELTKGIEYPRIVFTSEYVTFAANNKELLVEYKKYIKLCADLVYEIAIPNNSISLMSFMDFSLPRGFFSYNVIPITDEDDTRFAGKADGISIVTGNGVCRHVSRFITDVLNYTPEFCENFYCVISTIRKSEFLDGSSTHIANLIRYHGTYYVYDCFNNLFFEFTSLVEVRSVYHFRLEEDQRPVYMYYKPLNQMIKENMSLDRVKEHFEWFKGSAETKGISPVELIEIRRETLGRMLENESKLKDFESDTSKIKEKIYHLAKHE